MHVPGAQHVCRLTYGVGDPLRHGLPLPGVLALVGALVGGREALFEAGV